MVWSKDILSVYVLPIACALGFLTAAAAPSHALRVVVTIKPVHSLAASILDGVTQPKLLLKGEASPHSYALKPSDARAVNEADIVIIVSKNLEVFLEKAVATLPANSRVIDLEHTPGLTLLPVRDAGPGSSADADESEDHDDHRHGEGSFDVHFWLDPSNAIAIARELARQFSQIDPEHAALYEANAKRLEARLALLDVELRTTLSGLSGKPFIVFHDVTQYLEARYGLNGLGAITLSPERAPGAKRLAAVRARIKETRAICVFSEPEFPPKLVQTLTMGTQAKQGVLDEVGAAIPAGTEQYFTLMRANAGSLAACLKS
jgi:zinc transport system substrate-binding protein